jgi:hypothetical protein
MIMQPIPSRLGWLLHVHSPLWVHTLLLAGMFFAEIIVPFLVFFTGWPRLLAALVLVGLQAGIQLHGNFGYFNVLTALLCIPLLDQHASLFDTAEPLVRPTSTTSLDTHFFIQIQQVLVRDSRYSPCSS